MFRNWLLFSVFLVLLQACQAESQKSVPLRGRDKKVAIKKQEKEKQSSSEIPKAQPEPEIIPPVPMPPYGPFDPMPYPYDPPGYISEPVITCVGPPDPLPRTIRDSIVIFPATPASFGSNLNDFNKYIDSQIVGTSGQATPGQQIAQTLAARSEKPIKAYVVSGDVTSQQALDRRTTRAATFSGG